VLAELLARPQYLNAPHEVIRQALSMDRTVARRSSPAIARNSDWRIRSFVPTATFPSKTHSAWFAAQMVRWGHLRREADVLALAQGCSETAPYRAAARSLHLECPATDFPPMHLPAGVF